MKTRKNSRKAPKTKNYIFPFMLKIIGQPWHLIFFNLHASTYTQTLIANFDFQLHKIRINIPSQIGHSIYHRFNENHEIPFFKLTYIISSQIKDLILKFSREAQPRKKCRGLHVLLRKHFEKTFASKF